MSFTADKENKEASDLISALPSTIEAPSFHVYAKPPSQEHYG
jgi:hypothetical protein